jgi:phosphoglycolate phosphatase
VHRKRATEDADMRRATRAVLFDIDGTLLVTGGAGGAAWQRGFEQLYGVEADVAEHTDAGMTDPRSRRSSSAR